MYTVYRFVIFTTEHIIHVGLLKKIVYKEREFPFIYYFCIYCPYGMKPSRKMHKDAFILLVELLTIEIK